MKNSIFKSESLNKTLDSSEKYIDLQKKMLDDISHDIKSLNSLMKEKCCPFTELEIGHGEFLRWDGNNIIYHLHQVEKRLIETKVAIRIKLFPLLNQLLLKSIGIIQDKEKHHENI